MRLPKKEYISLKRYALRSPGVLSLSTPLKGYISLKSDTFYMYTSGPPEDDPDCIAEVELTPAEAEILCDAANAWGKAQEMLRGLAGVREDTEE